MAMNSLGARLFGGGAAILLLGCAGARAEDASAWFQGMHSQVRLISGGEKDGRLLAAVEIVLDRGFKTYWRNPGESGLPPRFDWSGSSNVAAIDLKWPAPARTEDAGGVAYVYGERAVFPLLVEAREPGKPVKLKLDVDYGVCKDLCIPASASLSLDLTGEAIHRATIEGALARVPIPQPAGYDAPLSIGSVEPLPGQIRRFAVHVRAPEGSQASLFAEAPENWFLSTSAEMQPTTPGSGMFILAVEEHPKPSPGSVPVRLTLVASGQAVETEIRLDLGQPPR